jgi:histidinol-phosphate aminotransferase
MVPDFIREHIREIDPYQPIIPLKVLSEQMGQPIEQLIKLDANENPYGMPPSAQKRLADLRYGHIYPDPESRQIRQKLSEYLQIPFENILVGAGADELIDLIARLTMDPGDKIIDCPPTFGFYVAIAQINNLSYVPVNRHKDFSLNVDEIKNAVKKAQNYFFWQIQIILMAA